MESYPPKPFLSEYILHALGSPLPRAFPPIMPKLQTRDYAL